MKVFTLLCLLSFFEYTIGVTLQRTPIGYFAPECIRGVPSGTTIRSIPYDNKNNTLTDDMIMVVEVIYPNNTYEYINYQQSLYCSLHQERFDRSNTKESKKDNNQEAADISTKDPLPIWNGWPRHAWYGSSYADWSNPRFPTNESIFALIANWIIPPYPVNQLANTSDPWYQAPPTTSWWTGIQGPTVLQPVIELNGLTRNAYDAVSWNCCPGNMSWYSDPLVTFPDDTIQGIMVRQPSSSGYVFETITTVISPLTGTHSTRLSSDMSLENGWAPTWAEIIFEEWFITSCTQLICGPERFFNISLYVEPRGQPYNATPPRLLTEIPWSVSYEIDGFNQPANPTCDGHVQTDNVTYNSLIYSCT